ncbi:MAG: hypothetical protein GY906_37800, partial [bacterium]|nr:hypothetical protein [bacterium]
YLNTISQRTPAIATLDHGPVGVFFGYDFHTTPDGPRLIEINTNAGGALLNALLAASQRVCCDDVAALIADTKDREPLESAFVTMFRDEWRLAGKTHRLRTIAIVDESPHEQPMNPEFVLFKQLFESHGIKAVIADPSELSVSQGALWYKELQIDLVYNRLCDFAFETSSTTALRTAYIDQFAVVTPHPRAHALWADKSRLALLSDSRQLAELGASPKTISTLKAGIPRTRVVRHEDADQLWSERKRLFFKPYAGYGSRGAYRGAKLTRRVWRAIVEGDYVAQAFVPPGELSVEIDGKPIPLKYDVRAYTYAGKIQLLAARLYQGQTTNMRTPGGGFAPVVLQPRTMAALEN